MSQKESKQEDIVEDFPYLQELMQAVAAVRHSIDAGKDGRDAAENLIAEIPEDWTTEIQDKLLKEEQRYNLVIGLQNRFLVPGYTQTQKMNAQNEIMLAGKRYSRRVVKIAISLFKQKDMLFKTRKKASEASLSIFELGEADTNE